MGGGSIIGMPIGNLTSQIFANIYLNELDRFVKHILKPKAYLRYGDDFILLDMDKNKLENMRVKTINFLANNLKLKINSKHDLIVKAKQGLRFLGVEIWPSGRRLKKRNRRRIKERLNPRNIPSYHGLVAKHEKQKIRKEFDWEIYDKTQFGRHCLIDSL